MTEKPWAERTTDEKYAHAPGQFDYEIDRYAIPGEPELSMIVRRVCRVKTVWPTLIASHCRHNFVVFARRLVFRAAYETTDLSVENIAELFGFSPSYVRQWATSWVSFQADDPEWWHYWGPANADLIGVPLEAA